MSPYDWDRVPQPIRAMAFVRMMRFWSQHYRVGHGYALPTRLVGDTLAAIVMVESWFEHRGTLTNSDGTRDMGLGGSSDYCRTRMRQLQDEAVVDVGPPDDAYFNPWVATRVVAIWFQLMLAEAGGDLDLAIGAYRTGISDAAGDGASAYAANVRRNRRRFIRNVEAPPAWTFLYTTTERRLARR